MNAMRQDSEGRLEAQRACGCWGRIDAEWQYNHLAEGFCPTCRIAMDPHDGFQGTHGRCPCCSACWTVDNKGFGHLIHPPSLV